MCARQGTHPAGQAEQGHLAALESAGHVLYDEFTHVYERIRYVTTVGSGPDPVFDAGAALLRMGAWSDDGSAEVLVAWVDAIIASTASRHASRKPLDVDAAVAELRKIAQGRGDLLAARAGVILAFHNEDARDGRWPRRAPEAALCIAAGADLTQLMEWIVVGQERAERIR